MTPIAPAQHRRACDGHRRAANRERQHIGKQCSYSSFSHLFRQHAVAAVEDENEAVETHTASGWCGLRS